MRKLWLKSGRAPRARCGVLVGTTCIGGPVSRQVTARRKSASYKRNSTHPPRVRPTEELLARSQPELSARNLTASSCSCRFRRTSCQENPSGGRFPPKRGRLPSRERWLTFPPSFPAIVPANPPAGVMEILKLRADSGGRTGAVGADAVDNFGKPYHALAELRRQPSPSAIRRALNLPKVWPSRRTPGAAIGPRGHGHARLR